jgi:predicted phage terminase large subunit-like protein
LPQLKSPLKKPPLGKEQARIRAERLGLTDELKAMEQEVAKKQLALLKRQQRAVQARDDFMAFVKFTMPDPSDPNDIDKSLYEDAKHHRAIARVLEEVVVHDNIQFLILTTAPRHGKSQLVSRHLPAWYMGRYPDESVVVATYNDDFAKDFGADVRSIITTSAYRQVFPEMKLQRGGTAKDRLQTMRGGMATFVGLGGSLTGRGAHCFPAGTLVWTTAGQVSIEQLKVAPPSVKVFSYDRQNRKIRTQSIQAFSARQASRLLRITTASGRVVTATPNHPFLTKRGYVQADQLTAGDSLVCAVPNLAAPNSVRGDEAFEAGPHGDVLLKQVLGGSPEREDARLCAADLPRVQGTCAKADSQGREEQLLLDDVHGNSSRADQSGSARGLALDGLRGMQHAVSIQPSAKETPGEEEPCPDTILREGLRRPSALPQDGWGQEPSISPRAEPSAQAATFRASVSADAGGNSEAGQVDLRAVQHQIENTRPPHQSAPDGQPLGQPDLPLCEMPRSTARGWEIELQAEADVVLSIDEHPVGSGGVEVYDIQVEEDHNFFANGVCVHNCLIIDDVVKSNEEARSKSYRDRAWDWFTKVAMTRRMGKKRVIITFTRWHEDDIIGRLTDPNNEHYSHTLAKKIKIIDLPAIAGPDDPLGRTEGEPLWPERYDLSFLEEQRALDPLGFEALYQQRPSVADGVLFRREHIRHYDPADLPSGLRIYCASDHAVTTNQRSDSTVLLKVGVDKQNNIYLLDCWWRKARTPEVVEAMLEMARTGEPPLVWWAERGHITQSIGPFLRKRMEETSTFINIVDVTPVNDKEQRAQSIAARMAMGYVHFPKDKPWVGPAIEQLMSFPNGKHDDFCDTLAWVGLGLRNMVPGSPAGSSKKPPRFGTLNWVKEAQRQDDMRLNLVRTGGF